MNLSLRYFSTFGLRVIIIYIITSNIMNLSKLTQNFKINQTNKFKTSFKSKIIKYINFLNY
jgi:hypothetical protein